MKTSRNYRQRWIRDTAIEIYAAWIAQGRPQPFFDCLNDAKERLEQCEEYDKRGQIVKQQSSCEIKINKERYPMLFARPPEETTLGELEEEEEFLLRGRGGGIDRSGDAVCSYQNDKHYMDQNTKVTRVKK